MKTDRLLLVFVLACIWNAFPAMAQLYNETKDTEAQNAVSLARQITNAPVFQLETRNIETLGKLQIQEQLDIARVEWLNALDAFTNWSDVRTRLAEIRSGLSKSTIPSQAERDERLRVIREQQEQLKAALDALRPAEAKDPAIFAILDNLDKGEAALGFAARVIRTNNVRTASALEEISSSLATIKSLYTSWKRVFDAERAAQADVSKLAVPRERLELDLLAAEVDRLSQTAAIAAREALETEEVLQLVNEAEGRLKNAGVSDTAAIEETLRTSNREDLYFRLDALHLVTAASVRNTLPVKLANLRATQQEWSGSVSDSAAIAKNYEQMIVSSVQRLALYYKGGIKPGQIAQLLYNLSGLVSLPIIAAK